MRCEMTEASSLLDGHTRQRPAMPELSKHAPTSVDGVGWPSGKGDLRTAASACRVAPIHAEACREVCHRLPKESRDTSHSIRIATLRLSAGTARTLGILIASTPFSLNTASICSVLCPLFALGEGVGASILHKDLHVVRPSPGSSRLISRVFRHCAVPFERKSIGHPIPQLAQGFIHLWQPTHGVRSLYHEHAYAKA